VQLKDYGQNGEIKMEKTKYCCIEDDRIALCVCKRNPCIKLFEIKKICEANLKYRLQNYHYEPTPATKVLEEILEKIKEI